MEDSLPKLTLFLLLTSTVVASGGEDELPTIPVRYMKEILTWLTCIGKKL